MYKHPRIQVLHVAITQESQNPEEWTGYKYPNASFLCVPLRIFDKANW
jgi:hypothetical protein